MSGNKFYICERCGNVAGKIFDSGVDMVCCGKKMTPIIPGTVEASREKHLPVVKREGDVITVSVGSVEHPMATEHSILWVYLETDRGGQRKALEVGEPPVVSFALCGERPIAAYAYCNIHGLCKTDIE